MLLGPENASASVPASMIETALRMAFHATLGRPEMVAATSPAVVLANGATRAMLLGKAKVACAALLMLVALATAVARTAIGPEPPGPGLFESRGAASEGNPPRRRNRRCPSRGLPDRATARLGTTHLRHDGQANLVVFSPDSRTVASTSFNKVYFWDSATGGPAPGRPTLEEWANVISLAYSPDGNTIAIGHFDGVVRLWDLAAGRERLRLGSHRGWVNDIAFAPDGTSLATATSGDSHIRVWDIATGREQAAPSIDGPVGRDVPAARRTLWHTLTFAPDSKRVAVAAWPGPGQGEMIAIWDLVGSGKPLIVPNGAQRWHAQPRLHAGWTHPPLEWGSTPGDSQIMTRRSSSVEFLPPLEFVPQLRLWDADTGRLLRELDPGDMTGECAITLSRDGRTLVSHHRDRLLVWDLASGRIARTILAETNNLPLLPRSLALGPDGRTLAAVRGDHAVHFWDLGTGQPLFRRGDVHGSAVHSVAIAPGGRLAATGDARGTIHLWVGVHGPLLRLRSEVDTTAA